MRTCSRCKVEKDESAFYATKPNKRVYRRCKECCVAVSMAIYWARTPAERERRKPLHNQYIRNYRARNLDRVRASARNSHLRKSYGLTLDEQNAYASVQGGRCAICRNELLAGTRDMSVDHCHRTGQVRGLLCNSCNLGLGNFADNPVLLNRAIVYLIKDDAPSRLEDIALIQSLNGRRLREQNVRDSIANGGR